MASDEPTFVPQESLYARWAKLAMKIIAERNAIVDGDRTVAPCQTCQRRIADWEIMLDELELQFEKDADSLSCSTQPKAVSPG
jgi:hypothetical protein